MNRVNRVNQPKAFSMKQRVQLLIAMVCLTVVIMPLAAQEEAVCSPSLIAASIQESAVAYAEQHAEDTALEPALNSMDTMMGEMNVLYAACDEARYQSYVDEGTALLEDLQAGGFIIYVRHARTDSSQEDTDTATCETQRNLSQAGREDAARMGEAWKEMAVPVGEIISTEYCRTRETAQFVFGEPIVMPRAELEPVLGNMLATIPAEGMNTVIVGHVDLLEAVTGIRIPEDVRLNEGDALVYRPMGGPMGDGGYELVTRIGFRNWFDLARIAGMGG